MNNLTVKNKIIMSISIVAQLLIVISYHLGQLDSVWKATAMLAIASICVIIIVNAILNWKNAMMLSLSIVILLIGICKIGIVCGHMAVYTYASISNKAMINRIENNVDYSKLFSIDDSTYYVDKDYMYLYEIDKSKKNTIDAYEIMIDSDIEKYLDLSESGDQIHTSGIKLTPFFSFPAHSTGENNKTSIDECSDERVSIAFVMNSNEYNAMLKIINKDNKVFYTYIPIKSNSIIRDLQIKDISYSTSMTNITITKPIVIVDGIVSDEEIDFVKGSQYMVTINNDVFVSKVELIEFDDNVDYVDRVNQYIYKDTLMSLYECQELLDSMSENDEDYNTTKAVIEALEASLYKKTVELVYEKSIDEFEIRMYRVINTGDTKMSDASVVEVYRDRIYYYGNISIDLDELK